MKLATAFTTESGVSSIFPILRPQDYAGTLFANGVCSPLIVIQPATLKKELLFLGWTSDTGYPRSLFKADIDDTFKISNIHRILNPTDLLINEGEVYFETLEVISVAFFPNLDPKRWVLFFAGRPPDAVRCLWYVSFDEALEEVSEERAHFILYEVLNGASIMKGGDGQLALMGGTGLDLDLLTSSHMNYPFAAFQGRGAITYGDFDEDGQHFLRGGEWTLLWATGYNTAGPWSIKAAITPQIPFSKQPWVLPAMSTKEILPFICDGGGMGNMHWTTLMGTPVLLFSWFRGCEAGYGSSFANKFRHELWGWQPDCDPFEIDRLKPFQVRPFAGDQSGTSKWIPTFGLKAEVSYQAGSAGHIYIDEGFDIRELSDAVDGSYYTTTELAIAGAGAGRHLVENPAPWLRVRLAEFTVNTKVYVHLS